MKFTFQRGGVKTMLGYKEPKNTYEIAMNEIYKEFRNLMN